MAEPLELLSIWRHSGFALFRSSLRCLLLWWFACSIITCRRWHLIYFNLLLIWLGYARKSDYPFIFSGQSCNCRRSRFYCEFSLFCCYACFCWLLFTYLFCEFKLLYWKLALWSTVPKFWPFLLLASSRFWIYLLVSAQYDSALLSWFWCCCAAITEFKFFMSIFPISIFSLLLRF